jgi:molecular chaperone GrpE
MEKPKSEKPAKGKEDKLKELELKLAECEKAKKEYLAGWQRARADFLNYQKEELKRTAELMEFSKKELLIKVLGILDNIERAIGHFTEKEKGSEWAKGIIQIRDQFRKFLEEEGVEEIKSEGEKFDPNFHEAVGETEVEGKEAGYVVEVLQKGYLLKGKLLRPAKVRVSK